MLTIDKVVTANPNSQARCEFLRIEKFARVASLAPASVRLLAVANALEHFVRQDLH
jgi:hypothetical protein